MTDEHTQAINGAAKKVDTAADKMWKVVRVVGALVVMTLVFQFALQYQILQLHDSVADIQKNTAVNAKSSAKTEKNVDDLTTFAHDLQTQTPQEQANAAATREAVALVPVIVKILCDQFPDAEGCPPA